MKAKRLGFVVLLLMLTQMSTAFAEGECEHDYRLLTPYPERHVSNVWELKCDHCNEVLQITFAEQACSHNFRLITPYPERLVPNTWELKCVSCGESRQIKIAPNGNTCEFRNAASAKRVQVTEMIW